MKQILFFSHEDEIKARGEGVEIAVGGQDFVIRLQPQKLYPSRTPGYRKKEKRAIGRRVGRPATPAGVVKPLTPKGKIMFELMKKTGLTKMTEVQKRMGYTNKNDSRGYTLAASNPDWFERVSPGVYRLKAGGD